MKLLLLETTYRRWLSSKDALALDSNLNEKFIGLTHDESVFFAKMSSVPLAPFELWDLDELERFLGLYKRHELTRAFQRLARGYKTRY
jgi:hypothetical protein